MKRIVNSENKRICRIMLIIVVLIAVFLMKPQLAKADIASGTWGTCSWAISDDGVLTIRTGTGATAGSSAEGGVC